MVKSKAVAMTQETETETKKMSAKDYIKDLMTTIVVPVVVTYLIFGVVFGVGIVRGDSMYPTLRNNTPLLFWRLGYTPKQGDVVIADIESENVSFIKRVIATEGQTVYIDVVTETVYVDGVPLDEPYLGSPTIDDGDLYGQPVTVPEGYVFLMGDNRVVSNDSRNSKIGMVPVEDIEGKTILAMWGDSKETEA